MAPSPLNFTKLIVGDLERSAAYYESVFGLGELYRFRGKIAGDPFEQVVMGVREGPAASDRSCRTPTVRAV